jgi:putative ABC transport system substrate-binding protein
VRRREFVTLLGGAAFWPRIAIAQHVPRIGCLVSGSVDSHGPFVAAFRQGLGALGYVEGRNIMLDLRWADGRLERLTPLAGELAALKPDVVVTAISAAAVAAKKAMPTVPIVSATLSDPIGLGLVASLNRPGGNVTGILFTVEGLLGKQLELARELKPSARRIGMLVNMRNPSNVIQRRDAEAAAPALGLTLAVLDVPSPEDIDTAFLTLIRDGSEFTLVAADAIFVTGRQHRHATESQDEIAPSHSITSSARARSIGEISRPTALAVLRLMTSSYFVGTSTGRSAGLVPLRILSTK